MMLCARSPSSHKTILNCNFSGGVAAINLLDAIKILQIKMGDPHSDIVSRTVLYTHCT